MALLDDWKMRLSLIASTNAALAVVGHSKTRKFRSFQLRFEHRNVEVCKIKDELSAISFNFLELVYKSFSVLIPSIDFHSVHMLLMPTMIYLQLLSSDILQVA
jgi:hypothetical protein